MGWLPVLFCWRREKGACPSPVQQARARTTHTLCHAPPAQFSRSSRTNRARGIGHGTTRATCQTST
eukprot:3180846-Prymnesium_polylepis.1